MLTPPLIDYTIKMKTYCNDPLLQFSGLPGALSHNIHSTATGMHNTDGSYGMNLVGKLHIIFKYVVNEEKERQQIEQA